MAKKKAKRDASKYLGGMTGKAASALRGRKNRIDSILDAGRTARINNQSTDSNNRR